MQRVVGIGGLFLKASDPEALLAWYRDVLGLDLGEHGVWEQAVGPTVVATFPSDTDYFGDPSQRTMLNFRVHDLEAMLAQLRQHGVTTGEPQAMEGVGRFVWVNDLEGNRIELWQPAGA